LIPFVCAHHQAFGSEVCAPAGKVDQAVTILSDGASLHVLIRGKRCDAPLLLRLHGGPGGAETPLFRLYDSELEESRLVAYWDQRGAGQLYDPDADLGKLTIAQHIRDLDHVIDRLATIFAGNKPVLSGHSWGGTLALLFARIIPRRSPQ